MKRVMDKNSKCLNSFNRGIIYNTGVGYPDVPVLQECLIVKQYPKNRIKKKF